MTRWSTLTPLPTCERIVESHARHQSLHWDAPHLEPLMETWRWRDAAATQQYLDLLSMQVDRFADRLEDRLPPERRALYSRLLDAAPRLTERFRTGRDLTIVQGDAHVWNCFLPATTGRNRASSTGTAGGSTSARATWHTW